MWLVHGTTRKRAESIVKNGPDPFYVEGGSKRAHGKYGFSMYHKRGPYCLQPPDEYAILKANLFPNEGGAVILEVDIPEEVVGLAVPEFDPLHSGPVQFDHGFGIDELLAIWPSLPKEIRDVK